MGLIDPLSLEALVATPPTQSGYHKCRLPLCSPLHPPTLPWGTPAPSSASTVSPMGISTLHWARQGSSIIARAQRFNKTIRWIKVWEDSWWEIIPVGLLVYLERICCERQYAHTHTNTNSQSMFALTETPEITTACDSRVKRLWFSQEQPSQPQRTTCVPPWNHRQPLYQILSQLLFNPKLVSIRSDSLSTDSRSDLLTPGHSTLLSGILWWYLTCNARAAHSEG